MRLLACALALATLAAAAPAATHAAKRALVAKAAAPAAITAKKTLRQYTGWVVALDKTSITVEKRGKQPESKVFARDADTSVTGDLAKDVRVTVYWRDENGRATAHRVVVRPAAQAAGAR
uniref:DUF5666 domain-containing protein n=1 Tax=Eiseniibacteriota bacterium TaxID=2212470 RepID=A0A832I341_UNCEI